MLGDLQVKSERAFSEASLDVLIPALMAALRIF